MMSDGVILRLNPFLPKGDGLSPAIVSAQPYGKYASPN